MNFEQARLDVINWITGFVEKPHPALSGWPVCPFARKARLEHKIEIRAGKIDPWTDLAHAELGDLDVLILVYDPKQFDAAEFERQVSEVNAGFLVPRGLYALGDHPDSAEVVKGISMNQGDWALAFLQDKNKLEHHARELADKHYYDGWDEQYLKDLFHQRQDPRESDV